MKTKLAAIGAAAVMGATALLPTTSASADHSWGGLHWPSNGRGVAAVNQAGQAYAEAIGHTVNKWRRAVAPYATPAFPQGPMAIRYEENGPPRCDTPNR